MVQNLTKTFFAKGVLPSTRVYCFSFGSCGDHATRIPWLYRDVLQNGPPHSMPRSPLNTSRRYVARGFVEAHREARVDAKKSSYQWDESGGDSTLFSVPCRRGSCRCRFLLATGTVLAASTDEADSSACVEKCPLPHQKVFNSGSDEPTCQPPAPLEPTLLGDSRAVTQRSNIAVLTPFPSRTIQIPGDISYFASLQRRGYKHDGHPEESSFVNAQGLRIHVYRWKRHPGSSQNVGSVTDAKRTQKKEKYFEWRNAAVEPERCTQPYADVRGITACSDPSGYSAMQELLSIRARIDSFDVNLTSERRRGLPQLFCNRSASDSRCKGVIILIHGYGEHCRTHFLSKPAPKQSRVSEAESYVESSNSTTHELHSSTKQCQETESRTELQRPLKNSYSQWEVVYEGSWVDRFNALGFDVVGIDLQGHGLSEGWRNGRCIVRNLSDYAVDVLEFIRLVKMSYRGDEPTRIFLIGLSMGGWAALRALELSVDARGERKRQIEDKGQAPISKSPIKVFDNRQTDVAYSHVFPDNFDFCEDAKDEQVLASSLTPNEDTQSKYQVAMEDTSATAAEDNGAAVLTKSSADDLSAAQLGLDGVILLSPMLSIDRRKRKHLWSVLRHIAIPLAAVRPEFVVAGLRKKRRLFQHLLDYYLADPLTHKDGLLAGLVVPMMEEVDIATDDEELGKISTAVSKSIFIVHHVRDPLCDFQGSLSCFERIGIADRELLQLDCGSSCGEERYRNNLTGVHRIVATDLRHDLANEPGERTVFEWIDKWLCRRCSEGQ